MLGFAARSIKARLAHNRRRRVYRLLKEFTMIPEWLYCQNLALAERAKDISGCVIECGVWRGGMCAGLHTVLGPQRRYFLFDSLKGFHLHKQSTDQRRSGGNRILHPLFISTIA
jgi:O-methyltransferase